MDMDCCEFIASLVKQSDGLQLAYCETLAFWAPETPPMTTLFAALGDRIAEDFNSVSTEVNRQTFRLIEDGMSSKDQKLVTAVATGLIEAIVSKTAPQKDVWNRLSLMFGDLSRMHAEAWLDA